MIKKIIALVAIFALLLATNSVGATPQVQRTLVLPEAADHSSVISLGTGHDPQSGRLVEGYAIIHYKGEPAKPDHASKPATSVCYGFLAKDAKWKAIEPWLVNPANSRGLGSDFIFSNLSGDIVKWENAAQGINILGNGSNVTDTLIADTASPDGQNEIYFANVAKAGAIAVTIVWGVFGGPSANRQLVEWDQIYDDVDFDWSSSGEANKMDFENIATHELGHSVGLADLYNSACSAETMYGYAGLGETLKQDLNTGDIAGVNKLY